MVKHNYNIWRDKAYFIEKEVKLITKSGTAYNGLVRDFNEFAWELESDDYIYIVRTREIEGVLIDKKLNKLNDPIADACPVKRDDSYLMA